MVLLKTIKQQVELKGKLIEVTLHIKSEEDSYLAVSSDFDFGDEEENAKYLARFDSGELVLQTVVVAAIYKNLEGVDFLGACHLRAKHYEEDILEIVRENGMIDSAIEELKVRIEEILGAFAS